MWKTSMFHGFAGGQGCFWTYNLAESKCEERVLHKLVPVVLQNDEQWRVYRTNIFFACVGFSNQVFRVLMVCVAPGRS